MKPTIFNILLIIAILLTVIAMVRPMWPLLPVALLLSLIVAFLDRRS